LGNSLGKLGLTDYKLVGAPFYTLAVVLVLARCGSVIRLVKPEYVSDPWVIFEKAGSIVDRQSRFPSEYHVVDARLYLCAPRLKKYPI